jgi:hypothetical protein
MYKVLLDQPNFHYFYRLWRNYFVKIATIYLFLSQYRSFQLIFT